MNHIFNELLTDWDRLEQRATSHLHHTSPTITVTSPPATPAQENTMSVPDAVTALTTNLEAAAAALTTALDEDVPGLENIGTQIDNSRLIQASVAADAVVPQAILDAEAAALEALTAAFTPAAPVQPVPADPGAEQPAA